jgi:uncharacterized protein (DUF433 family)
MEAAFDRITHIPGLLGGRATIRGLRISVAHVVNLVANGMTPQQIIVDLPDLDLVDVRQALGYAAALAKDELHPLRAWFMRFLADAGVSPDTVAFLTRLGHDAIRVRALDMLANQENLLKLQGVQRLEQIIGRLLHAIPGGRLCPTHRSLGV